MPAVNYLWNPLSDNIDEEYDDDGNVLAEYTHEPGLHGRLISEHRDGHTYYHHYDAQGNTIAITDEGGNVTDTFAYTANGEVTERTGTTETPFQFGGEHGYYTDQTTGEISVRRRDYDPAQGRWLSADTYRDQLQAAISDSLKGGVLETLTKADAQSPNRYWYAANNPIAAVDSSGEFLGFKYGNFCGRSLKAQCPPGSSPVGSIDALDAACEIHDCCIGKVAWLIPCRTAYCDLALCFVALNPSICNVSPNKAKCKRAAAIISFWMCNALLGTTPGTPIH